MNEKQKKRICWNCKIPLNFQEFYSTNHDLTESRALELWNHPAIELFCCSCYSKELRKQNGFRECEFESRTKKILVMGIQNAGKTAIINAIRDKCLQRTQNLLPTKGISRNLFCFNDYEYIIWDMGGAYSYRERYLKKSDLLFAEAKELIYVIDIQDPDYYDEILDFLSKILHNRDFQRLGNTFKIKILFHKADPTTTISIRSVNGLLDRIKSLEIPYDCDLFKTSIQNFQSNYLELESNQFNSFGQLIYNLFCFPNQKIESFVL